MKNLKIYLDQNVLSNYLDGSNEKLNVLIKKLKEKNYFFYSPAHMEELATPYMKNKNDNIKKKVKEEIQIISNLTNNHEIHPRCKENDVMHIKIEDPYECFTRVIKLYDRNVYLEKQEKEALVEFKKYDEHGELSKKISNQNSSILLTKEHSRNITYMFQNDFLLMFLGGKEFNYPDILNQPTIFERCTELLFIYLESIRYCPEPIKHSTSRMHDVSHAIYASMTDLIITDDKKFSKKIKAVYKYWGIKTEVYNSNDLIKKVVNI